MMTNQENTQKYENYRIQSNRLKKAMDNYFYLEAVFIEYAIMEDRLTSILRYENNSINSKKHVSIDKKINKVRMISQEKKGLAGKYFSDTFLDSLHQWKEKRNPYIHSLMKLQLSSDNLKELAVEGNELQRELCKLSQKYKRAVERSKQP